MPSQVQIGVNINMLDIDQRSDGTLDAPFVFTVNYTPSIAQISIKGRAKISGDSEDTKKILDEHKAQKSPPVQLVQAVSNAAIAGRDTNLEKPQRPPAAPTDSATPEWAAAEQAGC